MLASKNQRGGRRKEKDGGTTSGDEGQIVSKTGKCGLSPPATQQFGVSLQFIKENNPDMVESIPPVVRQCVEFLSRPDGKQIHLHTNSNCDTCQMCQAFLMYL